jgi:GDSL-like lipase/acylhydrolase family protein
MRRTGLLRGAWVPCAIFLAACGESVLPTSPANPPTLQLRTQRSAQDAFARYVAIGTSNSMGVQSAGIYAAAQRTSWPALLAAHVGSAFSLPLVQDPGCGPPLQPPLAADVLLIGAFSAFGAGGDLVTALQSVCMPLQNGILPGRNNLAISGAKARDALNSTPESEGALNARRGAMYSRVLPPGMTQVTAMLAQNPTFVSVELAANEVLPATTGRISAMTPLADWIQAYDQIIGSVRSTGASAVLVGLPSNAANFPSVRRAREFWNQWPYLLGLGIRVSSNCYFSSNYIFLPGYLLKLLAATPTTATCADTPGVVDYVLTPSEMNAINALMAQMNSHIQSQANANGYAYFTLGALYDLPKPTLNLGNVLFSSTPFGANISLDGVHPSAAGQGILASAAVAAINAKYNLGIH